MDASAVPTKRIKTTTVSTVAATFITDLVVSEPWLWTLILSFIPSDTVTIGNPNYEPRTISQTNVVLETIASLCRVVPTLSRILCPTNEIFWRTMAHEHFDFSPSEGAYNIEMNIDYWGDNLPRAHWDGKDEVDPAVWEEWCQNPQKSALETWMTTHSVRDPKMFLEEGYAEWSALGVSFRPSQYGFLHDIQVDKSRLTSAWPIHEQAFSLFRDLVASKSFVQERIFPITMCMKPIQMEVRSYHHI